MPASTPRTHVLVDWENVRPKEDDIRALVRDVTDVWLFHGPTQKMVEAHHASFGDQVTRVPIARSGKNALDFHLSFYIGYIASRYPDAHCVVISNDLGYGPMLEHAVLLGFNARRMGFSPAPKANAPLTDERAAAHGLTPQDIAAQEMQFDLDVQAVLASLRKTPA